jgi:hypothetical protein
MKAKMSKTARQLEDILKQLILLTEDVCRPKYRTVKMLIIMLSM